MPFYHLVSDKEPSFVKNLYQPKTIAQFKADLDLFLNYYQPISLEQVIQYNKGEIKLIKPSFHLTFDDGLANFYHVIAPILIEKKIPATVFLNTGFVDNKDLFYRYKEVLLGEISEQRKVKSKKKKENNEIDKIQNFLIHQKPYLSLKQIKELQQQGFTFGAHSVNHPLYTNISLDEQLKQTNDSLQWVNTHLNQKYNVFSFPFHDIGIGKQFFNTIKNNIAVTFGTSGFNLDQVTTNLHRLDMEKSTGNTKQFLIAKYLKYLIKKRLGKHIIQRK